METVCIAIFIALSVSPWATKCRYEMEASYRALSGAAGHLWHATNINPDASQLLIFSESQ